MSSVSSMTFMDLFIFPLPISCYNFLTVCSPPLHPLNALIFSPIPPPLLFPVSFPSSQCLSPSLLLSSPHCTYLLCLSPARHHPLPLLSFFSVVPRLYSIQLSICFSLLILSYPHRFFSLCSSSGRSASASLNTEKKIEVCPEESLKITAHIYTHSQLHS